MRPHDLPDPRNDGAARHLDGMILPDVSLAASGGGRVSLARLSGRTIVYTYPGTSEPDRVAAWDSIPDDSGCTRQACDFRDHHAALLERGVDRVHGLSTQTSADQAETARRLHLPFALLADPHRAFTLAARLPTVTAEGTTRLQRLILIVDEGRVTAVIYPVVPPDWSAADLVARLDRR